MADISKELKAFKEAIYGEDVRDTMIDAFNAINESTIGLADAAKASENAAKASENAAKASETAASTSASEAAESRSVAESCAAGAAELSKNAQRSAESAEQSATSAASASEEAQRAETAAARSAEEAARLSQQEPFLGATSTEDGTAGSIPRPKAGDEDKVLQGNGSWGHKLQIDVVVRNNVYGYLNGAGAFVPFKSQSDIDAAVTAAKVGNAAPEDVLSGQTFTNASKSGVVGTMPNNGAVSPPGLNCGDTYVIPEGYHSGDGVITANPLSSQTDANAGAGDILSTKTAWVKGRKFTGNMPNRGAWTSTPTASGKTTIPSGYHNGSGYVDTSSVYNKGKTDGYNSAPKAIGNLLIQNDMFNGLSLHDGVWDTGGHGGKVLRNGLYNVTYDETS